MKSNLTIEKWLSFVETCPHEFTIQYPPRPEYFMENFAAELPPKVLLGEVRPRLLYVHVPFCEQRCAYCIFATDPSSDSATFERYVNAVLAELKGNPRLDTDAIRFIDVGGGTPTRLPVHLFEKLFGVIGAIGTGDNDTERSFETTAVELCREPVKAQIARRCGFDRISIGVQTTHAATLRNIHRSQHWEDVVRASEVARSAGIQRINMDLIFGLQGQDMLQWRDDVSRVVALRPDSITTYDCLYRGTGHQLVSANASIPPIELLGEMYDWSYDYLSAHGYHADYGSVNFSAHAAELGTSRYFERRVLWGEPYIGIGNYATTLLDGHWFFNFRGVAEYADRVLNGIDPVGFHYKLPPEEQFAKYVLFSLNYGIIMPKRFAELFGLDLWDVYGSEIDFAIREGWLHEKHEQGILSVKTFSRIHCLRSLFYSRNAKLWFMRSCGGEDLQ